MTQKNIYMWVNIEERELVKYLIYAILKMKETFILFLSMVITGLKCIKLEIGLNTCVKKG